MPPQSTREQSGTASKHLGMESAQKRLPETVLACGHRRSSSSQSRYSSAVIAPLSVFHRARLSLLVGRGPECQLRASTSFHASSDRSPWDIVDGSPTGMRRPQEQYMDTSCS